MQSVVLSLLASAIVAAGPTPAPADDFKPIGRTSYGTVLVDVTTVEFKRTKEGGLTAGMLLKVQLNKPLRKTHSVVNAVVFSCNTKSAIVVASTSLDAAGLVVESSEKTSVLPWVKGSDSVTNVVMEKLCKGEKPVLPRGVLET